MQIVSFEKKKILWSDESERKFWNGRENIGDYLFSCTLLYL